MKSLHKIAMCNLYSANKSEIKQLYIVSVTNGLSRAHVTEISLRISRFHLFTHNLTKIGTSTIPFFIM